MATSKKNNDLGVRRGRSAKAAGKPLRQPATSAAAKKGRAGVGVATKAVAEKPPARKTSARTRSKAADGRAPSSPVVSAIDPPRWSVEGARPLPSITLEVTGRALDDDEVRRLPPIFKPATQRGGVTPRRADDFEIEPHLRVAAAIDLRGASRASRGTPGDDGVQKLDVQPGQLVAIESDDGLILFTSGARLAETLSVRAPSAARGATVSLDTLAETALRRGGQDAARGGLVAKLASFATRVLVLDVQGESDPVLDAAKKWLREQGEAAPTDAAEWGASRLGAKALSYVVERKLLRAPGLYAFRGDGDEDEALATVTPAVLAEAARQGPLLVFIHGTASNTLAAYRGLRNERTDWQALVAHYGGRIFAFEHHTFSSSPIENARQLLEALPARARVHLVTHSRGGLVGDLLCVDWTAQALVEPLVAGLKRPITPANEHAAAGFARADAEDQRHLGALGVLARARRVRVERYVRVAAPANGTLLMSRNLDLFLSVVLNLLQLAAVAATSAAAAAPLQLAKRVVADIVRHRCDANVVPGLEAMLPLSSTARFLAQAPVAPDLALGVIAGDVENTRLSLRRLVAFFTDWTFFDRHAHDLVVDTDSMGAGVARVGDSARGGVAALLLDQGDDVDHVSYFRRAYTRSALVSWLTAAQPGEVDAFTPLPDPKAKAQERMARSARVRSAAGSRDRPIVVVLPGVMGSYLKSPKERLWTGLPQAFRGCTLDLPWPEAKDIATDGVFDTYYEDLCIHLERTHRVERFPYDWRLPIEQNASALRERLGVLMSERGQQPLRIVAHSMGGLVVRAMAAKDLDFWRTLLAVPGARVLMLGTPHQGAPAAAAMLVGRHDVLRKLAVAYNGNSLQAHVDFVATLPGALQLMPRREFMPPGPSPIEDYLDPAFWQSLRHGPGEAPKVIDRFFGNGIVGVPTAKAVAAARPLFALPGFDAHAPTMPGQDAAEVARLGEPIVMVLGRADETPIGLRQDDGTWHVVYSANGDGTVPWDSSRIAGIGRAYRVDAAHGDLCADERWFGAYEQILLTGTTTLAQGEGWPEPVARGGRDVPVVIGEPGPEAWPNEASLLRAAMGAGRRPREHAQRQRAREIGFELHVTCSAKDLRDATSPVLVGHYEGDPIAGPERTIDDDVVTGELSIRHHLGQYAGPVGTAAVVVLEETAAERARRTRRGAIVLGFGEFGNLTAGHVTQAVRAGCLRYLLACVDRQGVPRAPVARGRDAAVEEPLRLELSSLLLGHNSTSNISIADSVGAIVRGVVEANLEFQRVRAHTRQALIVKLEITEWYLDAAITAAKALRAVARTITDDEGEYRGVKIVAAPNLVQSDSMRPRLEAQQAGGYWPRLIVTGRVGSMSWTQAEQARASASDVGLPAPIADGLHFTYLSQRARVDAKVLHRQGGLVERLAQLSIDRPGNHLELGRTLFQLMTPLEFKDTARQIDRLVLVVDAFTANFPWELMVADDAPLIERMAVVRQFETLTGRERVRPVMRKTAYVVGDPSTRDFDKHFEGYGPMPSLPAAEGEARSVSKALVQGGFELTESIGAQAEGVDVIHRLFQRPYRVLHIAAHGMFGIRPKGGDTRSVRTGVVLSDGLLLTAAEVRQMEQVPDLVFLNCCHLGVIDAQRRPVADDAHLLAASLARELIDMGVRAVVAAGWPVDDRAAAHFASAFYAAFVGEGRNFGDAVRVARTSTLRNFRDTHTWGAYQAYGDPSFVLDPQHMPRDSSYQGEPFAAPEEGVAALDELVDRLGRPTGQRQFDTLAKLDVAVETIFKRCDESWLGRGSLLAAAASVYAAFGEGGFAKAVEFYLRGVGAPASDVRSYPSVRALERLANFEARINRLSGDEGGVKRAAQRLERMVAVLAAEPGADVEALKPPSPELCGLLGKCWKELAQRRAVEVGAVASGKGRASRRKAGDGALARDARRLLESARTWYRRGASLVDKGQTGRYCELNRLAIDIMLGHPDATAARLDALTAASLAHYERVTGAARVFEGLTPTETAMLRLLLEGQLGDAATREALIKRYRDERVALGATPGQWNSVVEQLELLADLTSVEGCPARIRAQANALRALRDAVANEAA